MSINNENILKIKKSYIIKIIIGIIIFIGSFIIFCFGITKTLDKNKEPEELNKLIESKENKIGKKAYLELNGISSQIAKYDGAKNGFYYAWDDNYNYIVYLKDSTVKKIINKDLEENPYKLIGTTSKVNSDLMNIIIKQYNLSLNQGEEKLDKNNFYKVFGDIYLNETKIGLSEELFYYIFGALFLLIGMIFLLNGIIRLIKVSINIKNIPKEELKKIEKELNDESSIYYEKISLYLTKKHIIMLDGRFKIINYSDILWMYPFEQKLFIFKGTKAIKILTSDNNTYIFANGIYKTKSQNKEFDEIWDIIVSHNKKIKLEYTKENIDYFNNKEEIERLE